MRERVGSQSVSQWDCGLWAVGCGLWAAVGCGLWELTVKQKCVMTLSHSLTHCHSLSLIVTHSLAHCHSQSLTL